MTLAFIIAGLACCAAAVPLSLRWRGRRGVILILTAAGMISFAAGEAIASRWYAAAAEAAAAVMLTAFAVIARRDVP